MWAYWNSIPGSGVATLIAKRAPDGTASISDFVIATVNGVLGFYASTNTSSWNLASGSNFGSPSIGSWNHLVVVRSGANVATFLNGVRQTSGSFGANSLTNSANNVSVGGDQGSQYFTGYLAGVRLLKGVAAYDPTLTTLTVPTAPFTSTANTSLLLNMTNGGIIDNAMMNDLETVGSAQISTAQSKFGGSSVLFNGTTDKCVGRTSPNLNMGSGDFTVECWVLVS